MEKENKDGNRLTQVHLLKWPSVCTHVLTLFWYSNQV